MTHFTTGGYETPTKSLTRTSILNSQSGIGLLEVVIASSILLVLLLASTSMLVSGQKGAQSVQKHLDASELQAFITQTLNNGPVCTQSLQGQPAPQTGAHVPTLTFANIKMDDSTNSSFANGQIKILSLVYDSASAVGSLVTANIVLTVSLQDPDIVETASKTILQPMNFPLVANVSSGVITSCGSSTGQVGFTGTLPPKNGTSAERGNSSWPCWTLPTSGSSPGWVVAPQGNIGAGRNCFAFVASFSENNDGQYSAGCYYDSNTGNVYACSWVNVTNCGYYCFN